MPVPIENLLDAFRGLKEPPYRADVFGPLDVYVGDLVVAHRKSAGGSRVEELPVEGLLDCEKAGLPEDPVDGNARAHLRDPVLAQHHDLHLPLARKVDQSASDIIDCPQLNAQPWRIRAKPLQIVVEVRKVDEGQGGAVALDDETGGAGNPLARSNPGPRPPKIKERKGSQPPLDGTSGG